MISENNMIKGCSLDGGGVKAIDEAVIIDYIEKRTQKPFYSHWDRMAGTSAGSEIVCQCTYPHRHISGAEIVDSFRKLASKVFTNPFWRKSVAGKTSSKYRVENLETELKKLLPNAALNESTVPLTIPTIDGDTGEEIFLKSDNAYGDWDMWAAATASSAAPYYFDGFKYRNRRFFDGGGAFNNPSRVLYRDLEKFHGASYDNCFILSIGCGTQSFSPYPNGGIQWISRLFEFGNRPATNTVSTFLSDDMGDNFVRLLVPHRVSISLDESNLKNIDLYISETKKWLRDNANTIEQVIEKMI
jgi:patatin-like phospholipase/acyl hydrolase